MLSIISSVGKNMEIGKNNSLIWHIPSDLKFFKNMTMDHTIVMGRNTYLSLPGKLPGRKIIVLSSKKIDDDSECVSNINEILNRYLSTDEEIFICGGASIYSQFIEHCKYLYLTEIDSYDKDADTFFPKFNLDDWNKEIISTGTFKNINYSICKYSKKN